MHDFPIAFELAVIAFIFEYYPGFFDIDFLRAADEVVGDFRAAIGEAFAFPFGGQENQFFFRHSLRLRGLQASEG
ncbi:hypothetical protein D3C87_1863380 [compost metagenome]